MKIINIIKALTILTIAVQASAYPENASLILSYGAGIDNSAAPTGGGHDFFLEDALPMDTQCGLTCYREKDPMVDTCSVNCFTEKNSDMLVPIGWFSFFKNTSKTICYNVHNSLARLYQYKNDADKIHIATVDAIVPSHLMKCKT